MSADLGEFEGHPITGMTIVLKMPGGPLNPAVAVQARNIAKGDIVDFLVRTVAGGVAFDDDKDDEDAYTRKQVMKVRTMTIVDAEFAAERIMAQEEANDRAKGVVRIPFGAPLDKGDIVHTDASGVQIIGDDDIAAARERGETVVETTPVIAEYDGDLDKRRMWPDEFGKGEARPTVGDDDLAYGMVTSLVDPTTGAVIGVGGLPDGTANADGDPLTSNESTEGGDHDGLSDGVPAGAETPIPAVPAGDVDPGLIDFLSGTVGDVKARVEGNLGVSFLSRALEVELGAVKVRPGVVSALKDRIAVLDGFA